MKNKLLETNNLSINFISQGKIKPLISGVNLFINEGEITALVGESGCGKSLTALSIVKLLDKNCNIEGSIIFEGKDLTKIPEKEIKNIRGNDIAMIFQEPMTALNPLHNIEKQIIEPLLIHQNLSKKEARKSCIELLKQVELHTLTKRLNAYPHELSGGQRQRVMIAMALANNPKLLIADEPTTALDVSVQKSILELLKKLQKENNLSILLITHDLNIVKKISDQVCVMHKGRVVEEAPTKNIFKSPQHQYTKTLLSSKPSGKPTALSDDNSSLISTNKLCVDFVTEKSFFGSTKKLLNAVINANISLKKGETLGIVGESGSGKSTLAMAILKLISSKGSIKLDNNEINNLKGKNLRILRKNMQIVFQDPFASLNPRMTIEQIILEGMDIHFPELSNLEKKDKILKTLDVVGLSSEMKDRYPHEFSGGQRQRIAIARAIILEPKIIVLDEPTSALDVTTQAKIVSLLRKLQKEYGISYLFISHDLKVIKTLSHRIIVMKRGKIVEQGNSLDIFKFPKKDYTKMLINASGV